MYVLNIFMILKDIYGKYFNLFKVKNTYKNSNILWM